MKLSVVIMLYNEEEVIDEFSERLLTSLRHLPMDYEVNFVVEGTDGTLEKVKTLAKTDPRIKVNYNERRLGLGKATKKGLGLVDRRSDLVLTMDSDLNHDPKEIINLLEASTSMVQEDDQRLNKLDLAELFQNEFQRHHVRLQDLFYESGREH